MKKRWIALVLTGALALSMLAGCSSSSSDDDTDSSSAAEESSETSDDTSDSGSSDGTVSVALSLASASDYYIGTMVGAEVQAAFEEAGADVQVLDGGNDVSTQLNQIQNAITSGVDIIYIFPAGDGENYTDVLAEAEAAGVTTMVSNNYPGEGAADVYVGNDEFQMGVMMAAMVSEWADETYPDAGEGEVSVLFLESMLNQNAIKRCLGVRMVSEKYLRYADITTAYFISEESDDVVYYLDEDGNEVEVDEPTGGLLLDDDGYAQLNPYYNEKIRIVEYSDRNEAGYDASAAQNAIDNVVTMGESDLCAVMSYGDVGSAVETKMREMSEDGMISTAIEDMAVFCSDLTDTNKELILSSATDESVLRGVMASGDLVATLCEFAALLVNGEEVAEYTMQPLSYVTVNEDGSDIVTVTYDECVQLPDTDLFFE